MSDSIRHDASLFSAPLLWVVRVLAWVGFGVAAYLAWTSIGQLPIAGCSGTGVFDCDAVHNSAWSRWLNLPVAIPGLACYASLATLSVMLGWMKQPFGRWVNTLFFGLAIVAGGAAVWFAWLQLGVLGKICPACMVLHLCGLGLAGLALSSVFTQPRPVLSAKLSNPSLMALRSAAVPTGPRPPRASKTERDSRPSLALAFGGALALMVMLVGGQLVYPAKEFSDATVELDTPINMSGSDADESVAQADTTQNAAQPHIAMRLPSDDVGDGSSVVTRSVRGESGGSTDSGAAIDESRSPSDDNLFGENDSTSTDEDEPATSAPEEEPKPAAARTRIVKLLGGKLSLDVYKYPLLGSPDAPNIVVELISYDCPHCRKMHRVVEKARKQYGDELAVVVLPVPLEKSCNKYVTSSAASHPGSCTLARYALAVATVEPKAFKRFHDWLMADEEKAPSIEELIMKANRTVNRERLSEVKYSDGIDAKINHNVELFAALQKQHRVNRNFGLPVQIVGDGVVSGVATADAISRTWEERLGIKPR